MPPISLLIVDDEQEFTEIMAQRLRKRGFAVTTATDGESALGCLEGIDIVILDVAMPGMNGIETLNAIKKRHPLVEVIMLTGQATVGTAVEAIRTRRLQLPDETLRDRRYCLPYRTGFATQKRQGSENPRGAHDTLPVPGKAPGNDRRHPGNLRDGPRPFF